MCQEIAEVLVHMSRICSTVQGLTLSEAIQKIALAWLRPAGAPSRGLCLPFWRAAPEPKSPQTVAEGADEAIAAAQMPVHHIQVWRECAVNVGKPLSQLLRVKRQQHTNLWQWMPNDSLTQLHYERCYTVAEETKCRCRRPFSGRTWQAHSWPLQEVIQHVPCELCKSTSKPTEADNVHWCCQPKCCAVAIIAETASVADDF